MRHLPRGPLRDNRINRLGRLHARTDECARAARGWAKGGIRLQRKVVRAAHGRAPRCHGAPAIKLLLRYLVGHPQGLDRGRQGEHGQLGQQDEIENTGRGDGRDPETGRALGNVAGFYHRASRSGTGHAQIPRRHPATSGLCYFSSGGARECRYAKISVASCGSRTFQPILLRALGSSSFAFSQPVGSCT